MAKRKNTGNNKKYLILIACIVIVIAAIALIGVLRTSGKNAADNGHTATGERVATDYVRIEIENYGTIDAELYGNVAPVTVDNFLKLVDEGFYDGLTFHRIISGFMIQGGDPLGNGMGGSDQKIKGEFKANGVENSIAHDRGMLSMARAQAYDSASSQFFIMHAAAPYLDGQYAAFGSVISGIEVVDSICENTPVIDGNGTVPRADQPVITSIRQIDKPAA